MEILNYTIVGFKNKNEKATLHKDNYTKIGAIRVFNKLVKSGQYESIVMWEEKTFDDCSVEISKPIKIYNKEN